MRVFTVEIDDSFDSLMGYPATFVNRKTLTRQLEQRSLSESSGPMHDEG